MLHVTGARCGCVGREQTVPDVTSRLQADVAGVYQQNERCLCIAFVTKTLSTTTGKYIFLRRIIKKTDAVSLLK